MSRFQITRLRKTGGPLTKRISLTPDGRTRSDGSACIMPEGEAHRVELEGIDDLAAIIIGMQPHEALALGALRDGLPERVRVIPERRLVEMNGHVAPDIVARTSGSFVYHPGRPALALCDLDYKGIPASAAEAIRQAGGYWEALIQVLPALQGAAHVVRTSTSAGIYRTDTGERFPGSGGQHCYIAVADGADVPRFIETLHDRAWLAGFGWSIVGKSGHILERSIVDRIVGTPERLVFEGMPVLDPPLAQDAEARRPLVFNGETVNTLAACRPLTIAERAQAADLKVKERHRLEGAASIRRADYVRERADAMVRERGIARPMAERIIHQQCAGTLWPGFEPEWDDPALKGTTIAEVMAEPARFIGATLADPNEGTDYGRHVAIVNAGDPLPWIYSFAHGCTIYRLRYDAAAIEARIDSDPPEYLSKTFAALVAEAEIGADDYERLRDKVAKKTGTGKRALDVMVKKARAACETKQHRAAKDRALAERADPRPQIPVPALDAPWLPQMEALNDVLGKSRAAEPPARDLAGCLVEVRTRRVLGLHALTATGANDGDAKQTRLPAPEAPLLTCLDEAAAAELIEHHIDYIDEQGRSVHLPTSFVKHFLVRGDEALAVMTGIATLPVVLANGEILAGCGLDRARGIVFRIPNELLKLLPQRCTAAKVAEAMKFLLEEWLCDVAADHEGKCVLIAAAASIIERYVLPERPAFNVTAGQRGTGKSTAVNMISTATTGRSAAAAAWSPNEEERRKCLLAYLAEGLPLLAWDNIPRGSAISCPSIEKALTAETYSDRVLGLSVSRTVSAAMIQIFTGNNISACGDLASRTLNVTLTAEQVDPENRPFKHADPIAWTEAHRGQILASIYTILLGNPRLTKEKPEAAETRFKMWWHLVGSAVENGWAEYARTAVKAGTPTISFKLMFIEGEEDEEQSGGLADALVIFREKWPDGFKASDVTAVLRPAAPGEAISVEAQQLIAAMEQAAGKKMNGISAQAVSAALKSMSDALVKIGDKTLKLKREPGTRNAKFSVKEIGAGGDDEMTIFDGAAKAAEKGPPVGWEKNRPGAGEPGA